MKKFVALAALITVSAAIAAPASAATLVRVSLIGKSDAQIATEIRTAAEQVCKADKSAASACIDTAMRDANRQLSGIIKARTNPRVATRQEAVTIVRVALKGKSADQINAEIRVAAQTVCKASKDFNSRYEFQACVGSAVRSAKAQLQAANGANKQLAAL